jgi:transposase
MSPKGDLLMILDTESWMNIRRFRALHAAGATFAEIGRECGCDWRTVRKYLAEMLPRFRRPARREPAPSRC